jgi:ABC-2 type transport system permease protein
MWAIIKKEFKSYFLSPIGYVYTGIFLIMCSLFFYVDMFMYQSTTFANMFGSATLILTFIVPILTMRMFAEERKNGTEQLLLTSPRSITQVVLGKFFGAGLVVLLSTAITIMYYFILKYFGQPQIGSTLVAILGMFLLSIAYVAFGMFASSITENQVVSAIISIGFFIVLWILPNAITSFQSFSLMYAFYGSFINGTISITNLVLLLSFTIMFILFTIMVLQRRKNIK